MQGIKKMGHPLCHVSSWIQLIIFVDNWNPDGQGCWERSQIDALQC